MPRAILLPPFSVEFFAGRELVEAPGATIFALVRALDGMAPGFAEAAEARAAIAVNGQVVGDWTTRLEPSDEVLFVPKVAGG
ncbi:MoaD/ThiS family protein [Novosphingobium sp. TH158]|uniref:MoaD/ThiS family protein n=1 Tax=Novosphingobium sp. TH158 TaxID=2067455 RepID=UPI000C7A2D54|nr:MoaD/ThiS family protein [Novosphingobium sp. TH158]PLK26452.1 hypothetical protein C0V78_05810 [Novosphingobium sp. TH158]